MKNAISVVVIFFVRGCSQAIVNEDSENAKTQRLQMLIKAGLTNQLDKAN